VDTWQNELEMRRKRAREQKDRMRKRGVIDVEYELRKTFRMMMDNHIQSKKSNAQHHAEATKETIA